MKQKVEDLVFDIAKPIVDKYKFELVEVEYKKEGSEWYLRIYIDKDGGITIDDCQVVSEELSEILDRIDPIDHSYIFEVSSPGIDRPLKTERDYKKNLNKEVEINFYKPFDGRKKIEGKLLGYDENSIEVEFQNNNICISKKDISLIRPVVKFD